MWNSSWFLSDRLCVRAAARYAPLVSPIGRALEKAVCDRKGADDATAECGRRHSAMRLPSSTAGVNAMEHRMMARKSGGVRDDR